MALVIVVAVMTEEAMVGTDHQVAIATLCFTNRLVRVGSIRWCCCPLVVVSNGEKQSRVAVGRQ